MPNSIIGLAREEAIYQGQPIAVILAEDEYKAKDLAEKVEVEYEPLPAVINVDDALKNIHKAKSDLSSNIVLEDEVIVSDTDSVFKKAYKIIEGEIINQRVIPSAMEPRGAVAYFDGRRFRLE